MAPLRPQLPKGATRALSSEIANLAKELLKYQNVAIVTGAGISTECGLSDYRSPGKQRSPRPPIVHQQYVSSAAVRKLYWSRSFVGYPLLSTARPGQTHHALTALHKRAPDIFRSHVTQNVDGLLQMAGTPPSKIIELHGSIHFLRCRTCFAIESRTNFQNRLIELNQAWSMELGEHEYRPDGDADVDGDLVNRFCVPSCSECGADALMPTVVFHGGTVPVRDAQAATRVVDSADSLLIVGSTMTTYSAFRLAQMAKKDGKFVGCINFGKTRADQLIDVKIEALVGDATARLAEQLLNNPIRRPEQFGEMHQTEKDIAGGMLQL